MTLFCQGCVAFGIRPGIGLLTRRDVTLSIDDDKARGQVWVGAEDGLPPPASAAAVSNPTAARDIIGLRIG